MNPRMSSTFKAHSLVCNRFFALLWVDFYNVIYLYCIVRGNTDCISVYVYTGLHFDDLLEFCMFHLKKNINLKSNVRNWNDHKTCLKCEIINNKKPFAWGTG